MNPGRKEAWALLGIGIFALAVRLIFLAQVEVVGPDEAYYIGMAAAMGEDRPYGGFDQHPFQKSLLTIGKRHGQPLVPFLFRIAGQGSGGRWVGAAQGVSLAFFLFSLPVFYLTIRRVANSRESFFSTLLFAFAPFSIEYSLPGLTHSVYIFFICAFFLCATRMLLDGTFGWAVLSGASLFGAYATRVESFFLSVWLMVIGMLCLKCRCFRRVTRPYAVAGVVFIMLSLPFWIWIRKTTGIWQLDWDLSGRAIQLIQQWHLPPSSLLAHGFGWEYRLADSAFILSFMVFYLQKLLHAWDFLLHLLPLPVWILSVLGLAEIALCRLKGASWVGLLLVLCLFHFLFYPLVGSAPRFFHPALALLLLGAGPGISFIETRIRAVKPLLPRLAVMFWSAAVLFCLIGYLRGYRSLVLSFRNEGVEMRRLGEEIRSKGQAGTFLASDNRSCFYAGPACRRLVMLHQIKRLFKPEIRFKNFLRDEKINFVVVDTCYIPKFFPEYQFLLNHPPEFLEKVAQTKARGERAILYRYQHHSMS